MAGEKGSNTGSKGDVNTSETEEIDTSGQDVVNRRNYLKLAAGATALGGLGIGGASAATSGGPPNESNWSIAFEDTFDAGSLDTSKWDVGYGWGMTDSNSAGIVSADHVNVRNGQLHLSVTYDGSITTSAVNTKNKHYYGPGTYFEARINLPGRTGILPSFWSKPNTEDWPPEIDFIEIFQNDGGWEDTHRAAYHIHYSTSAVSGDGSTHDSLGVTHDSSADLTSGFHVYGCRWLQDRVDFYFDGVHAGSITDSTALEALRNGGPQYMMLTNMIDKVGTTDKSQHWNEEMVVDWVRVWESGSSSGSGTTDDTSTTTEESTSDNTEHYLWVRASGSDPVTYAFETSGGNVRVHDTEQNSGESDEWVSADGTTAGGVENNSGGDGFWFQGEITDFAYDAPVDTYVDDQYVDPDSLVDPDSSGPQQPDDGTDGGSTDSSSTLAHMITIDGNSGESRYAVTVSEAIEPSDSLNDEDTISGTTAEGYVNGGSDSYEFDGEVTSLSLDGDATVTVDGERVDLLSIERNSGSSVLKYIVETTGTVIKADVSFASINRNDKVAGSKATGQVMGGTDAYWIVRGDVVDVSTFGGEVVTELNGDVVDLSN